MIGCSSSFVVSGLSARSFNKWCRETHLAVNEICVSEAFGVVEYGYDSWCDSVYFDVRRCRHRHRNGDIFRILQRQQTQDSARSSTSCAWAAMDSPVIAIRSGVS